VQLSAIVELVYVVNVFTEQIKVLRRTLLVNDEIVPSKKSKDKSKDSDDLDDLDYQVKKIPGVLESSLFMGYADRVILHGSQLVVKSRMNNPEL
jgi:hypothetical protein